ncbi:MAG: MOSC domain-containing protein [Caulobacteraceae bacterium]|jgi:uncharacterized protein YcbX
MTGRVDSLFAYPIKGFTPQEVAFADLAVGAAFPGDRLWAVEDGPSGFDPAAPAHVSKTRFTVLHKIAEVASARTHYNWQSGELDAAAPGMKDFHGVLTDPVGRTAFAAWLTELLGEAAGGPLQVLDGAGWRFLDHPKGHVSILNLASVRDLAARLGREVDPLRFRANLHVDGWPAWVENDWTGRELTLGGARARVFAPITRCAAPDVDPTTAQRDIAMTAELHRLYGHLLCGIYVQVTAPGRVKTGDAAELARILLPL